MTENSTIIQWGQSDKYDEKTTSKTIQVEDAFIRSSGLGAMMTRPLSWVFDNNGIYYDATTQSDLECYLENDACYINDSTLQRAQKFRKKLCTHHISKYNLSVPIWQRPPKAEHVILVPGQVESDASIRYGCRRISDNYSLLKTVRERNPDSYILYKPHPDVVAGLRTKGKADIKGENYYNALVTNYAISALIDVVDEVHTMTSLTGFEALIRDKKTVCYGQPFYAGWGLTEDIEPIKRRTKRLNIDQLLAATLFVYPIYIHPRTHSYIEAEQALDWLITERKKKQRKLTKISAQLLQLILRSNKYLHRNR